MRAHFPRNETLDSLSTLSSQVLNLRSRVKSRTAGRGQWGTGTGMHTKHILQRELAQQLTCFKKIRSFLVDNAKDGIVR